MSDQKRSDPLPTWVDLTLSAAILVSIAIAAYLEHTGAKLF